MSEETTNQPTPNNSTDGNQPESTSLIERADITAKRLEEANKKTEELVKQNQELATRMMLSGRSEAGFKAPEKSEEEKIREGTKSYFKGSQIEQYLK